MDQIALPDAWLMSDGVCLETARTLLHWAGYYLAHASATRTTRRASYDLSIATDSAREALAERQVPESRRAQQTLF